MERLVGYFYQLIYILFFLPIFSLLTKKKGYSLNFKDRFFPDCEENKEYIWFHCASVGELNLAKPLINKLKKENNILITVFSPRGLDYGKKEFNDVKVIPLPFDLAFSINRFLNSYRIKLGLIVEEEYWFNLLTISSKRFPILSVNSRVSKKSFKKYKKFYFFYRYIFNSFSKYLVRSETDYLYLKQLVKKEKLKLCGDLKYISAKPKKDVYLEKNNKKLIILASSHLGEEELVLKVFSKLKKEIDNLALLIAPRHLERVKEIEELIKKFGLNYSLRTENNNIEKDVYILNTLGELSGIYKYADVVVMGGTFVDIGGHNILEALYFNKPVIVGQFTYKIEDLVKKFSEYGIVIKAETEEKLLNSLREFLLNKKRVKNFSLNCLSEKILSCYENKILKYLKS